jgi:phage-related protein
MITTVRFGNGYEQRISKSINPDLKTLQLNFDQRTLREARAILHFLKTRGAVQSFAYNPGDIYSETTYRTRYVCREWDTTFTFKENYSIRAKFEEVSA